MTEDEIIDMAMQIGGLLITEWMRIQMRSKNVCKPLPNW